jgi:hypothetical protein
VCLPITGKLFGSFANFFDFRRVRLRGSNFAAEVADERGGAMVDFKGIHFPKEAISYAVFFYLRYPRSYRDLEEIMEERRVDVDHGTLNRWVIKFAPLMPAQA